MPTYDYYCSKCGQFEQFQKITEEPLTLCPHCGGEVRRQISRNVGIIFKGSGFYVTDHRKPDHEKKSHTDSSTGITSTASSEKKVS